MLTVTSQAKIANLAEKDEKCPIAVLINGPCVHAFVYYIRGSAHHPLRTWLRNKTHNNWTGSDPIPDRTAPLWTWQMAGVPQVSQMLVPSNIPLSRLSKGPIHRELLKQDVCLRPPSPKINNPHNLIRAGWKHSAHIISTSVSWPRTPHPWETAARLWGCWVRAKLVLRHSQAVSRRNLELFVQSLCSIIAKESKQEF